MNEIAKAEETSELMGMFFLGPGWDSVTDVTMSKMHRIMSLAMCALTVDKCKVNKI